MICPHPGCTGVHDNNRYGELCPRSLMGKRQRDREHVRNKRIKDPVWAVIKDIRRTELKHQARLRGMT